jgi:K+-transporting ATPase ATPase C chain
MFITSVRLLLATMFFCSIIYPGAVYSFSSLFAKEEQGGSLVYDQNNVLRGSRLVAQNFTMKKYFWPRPSAVDYNASASGGSNLSPANPLIRERALKIIDRLGQEQEVPSDLVIASGSGLDPHISKSAALSQVARVADARGLPEEAVQALIYQQEITIPGDSVLINVLSLNMALDELGS